jgi:hypothetical protein
MGQDGAMRITMAEIAAAAAAKSGSADAGWACAWLCACGYKGIDLLLEAVTDPARGAELKKTVMGVDGQGVSAVYLAPGLVAMAKAHGRFTYRNARHGLYVLPFAVREGLGVGCPVDPAFHIGEAREGNPYAEKLAIAERDGVEVDGELWARLTE